MNRLAVSAVYCAALALATQCLAAEKTRVAVLDFAAKSGVTQAQADALNDLVASQIQALGAFKVIAKADISAMLSMEEQKVKLTGCADDACLAEIGGALGVKLLVSGNLAQFGDVFLINLRLVDSARAEAVGRSSREVKGGQSALPAAVRASVAELFPKESGRAVSYSGVTTQPEGTTPPSAPKQEASSPSGVAPWITLGVAIAAAGAGGVVMGLGGADYSAMDDEFRGSETWDDLLDSGDTKMLAGGVLVGVGGAAAVATIVLFLVGGTDEPEPTASVMPVQSGAIGMFALQF